MGDPAQTRIRAFQRPPAGLNQMATCASPGAVSLETRYTREEGFSVSAK